MFSARFVITALATVFAVALAVPTTELEARLSPQIETCTGLNFGGTCIKLPFTSDDCINLTGGLSVLDKQISSATIPGGFICTFFVESRCVTHDTSETDEVTLQGGNYPSFTQIRGFWGSPSFNDLTSSIICSPL